MNIKNPQKKKALTKLLGFSLLVVVLVIAFPINIMDISYAAKPANPGSQGKGGGGQGGGSANAAKGKAIAQKNKNKIKITPRIYIRPSTGNHREHRVRQFCEYNELACGTNRKRIERTDEEKRLIAIELIETINRYRVNNNQKIRR